MYFLGIDCGTQGTKAVIFDSEKGTVLSKGYAKHDIIADDRGVREQNALWWIAALKDAVRKALVQGNIDGKKIAACAVSGQQHGLVLLNKNGDVIRNVKLWNDTSTASFNDKIIDEIGSADAVRAEIGTSFPVGFTASKIRYVCEQEPDIWGQTAHVLLPHDYINYYLTGKYATESSEASGTGYYDVVHKCYSERMMNAVDPTGKLVRCIPPVIPWDVPLGKITARAASDLGLSMDTIVAVGGGDNTMGAVGTSAVVPGHCTMSLGTSGTVCLFSPTVKTGTDNLIQVYDVLNSYLATVCTLNATSAANIVQDLFNVSVKEFDEYIDKAHPGSEGVFVLQYFNGERMPPLPHARGHIKHLTMQNCRAENIIRATAESVIYTLRWGYDKLLKSFPAPEKFIITGGGGNSAPWRQIVADVFDMPVHVMKSDEGGAFGAALQALQLIDKTKTLSAFCEQYIVFDDAKKTFPRADSVEKYKDCFAEFKELVSSEYSIAM